MSGRRRGCGCIVVPVVMLVMAAGAVAGLDYHRFTTEDAVLSADGTFEVLPGDGALAVLARLEDEGRITPSFWWEPWVRATGAAGCLVAGTHTLPDSAPPAALFEALCGPTFAPSVRVTVPEGTNVFQLADVLSSSGLGARDAYLTLWEDPALLASIEPSPPTLEGYLAPNTYEFFEDATPSEIVERLVREGQALRDTLGAPTGPAANYDIHALLTVASIVEEEAQVPEERPIIARVIFNRLATGMRIQCDPTCVYGPDTYAQVPTRALCRDPQSTHSTYVLPGLPPTPITNPGRAALVATWNPSPDPDVLYFVAMRDGTGRHAFADSLEAHNANVDRYLR